MRTIDTNTLNAITTNPTYKMWVRAEVDPSRSYFASLTDDDPYDAGDYSAITETPIGQCVVYSPTNSGTVTFIVNSSTGIIYAMVQGSVTQHSLGITAHVNTKPAVHAEVGGSCYLWYFSSGGDLTRVSVNMSTWSTSGSSTNNPAPAVWSIVRGSPHVLNATEIIFTYQTSMGGLGVSYYDGGTWYNWDKRFLSPNLTTESGFWSIYSTGAKLDGKVFAYRTDMDTGEVRGVAFDTGNLMWGDSFTALPADLSRFCIGNAIVANGYIHIAGQFHRTEDLVTAQVYSLAVRSSNGYNFSWDRFTLISKLGYQFQIAVAGDLLYASDRNSVGTANLSHYFAAIPGTRTLLQPPNDTVSFGAQSSENATMELKGHDEAYLDHAVVRKGSRCKVYIGYSTADTSGWTWVKYMDYIIDEVDTGFADGARSMVLLLTAEGVWKASQIAFPFYSEIISKSTLLDNCDERDHLYPATGGTLVDTRLVLDFWHHSGWDGDTVTTCDEGPYLTGKGSGFERKSTSGTYTRGFRTPDLDDYDHVKELPKIAATTVDIDFYGWSRTDTSSRANDTITLYMLTVDEDDNETWETGSLTSTYALLPQEYPDNESGSYPISYEFTGLTVGDFIKYIGVKYYNASGTGETWLGAERLEVTGITFKYGNLNTAKVWKQTKPSTYSKDDSTILEVPSIGPPYVQFLTRPYSAYNFSVNATFEYEDGDEPIYAGQIGWGVVGLAKDGTNYILARYSKTSSRLELVAVRDGIESLLGTYTIGDAMDVMLEHRDGLFEVRYKNGSEWVAPVITAHWDEATDGVISTSETDIMHVGVYGAMATPGYRHCSLNIHDANGLGMIASSDLNTIVNLPPTGKLVLDNAIIQYTGKTPLTQAYGPWQARNTGWYTRDNEDQMGVEIAHYHPDWSAGALAGYLVCAHNGHSWTISSSEWEVRHWNGPNPVELRNRVRHYGDAVNGNHVGTAHRMYEVPGVTGVSTVESDTAYMHPHGNWAFRWGSNQIWVKSVLGTMVDHDATVKDMTAHLCNVANIESEFPGDFTPASATSLSTSPVQIASTARLFPGGLDYTFTCPQLSSGHWIAFYASNLYVGDPADEEAIDIRIENSGGYYEIHAIAKDAVSSSSSILTPIRVDRARDIRILWHDLYCSVYIDDTWVHTFAWQEYDKDADAFTEMLKWPDTPLTLYGHASNNYSLSNELLSELFDWRHAIYIESEMSSASAIGSVIQERPVEIYPTIDGGLAFSYNIERDTVTYTTAISKQIIRKHTRQDVTSNDAGSDAVVYFRDIDFASDLTFADNEGFITRVLKLSTLDTGAKNAALILLEKANERQYVHKLQMRPDIRLEPGDRIEMTYTLPGTATVIAYDIIVEDVSMNLMEGASEMTITAREDVVL